MCQLSFVNLHDDHANKTFLIILSQINSWKDNQDGWGFYTPSQRLYKTDLMASQLVYIPDVFKGNFKSGVMSHVRKATFTTGAKVIAKQNSHPFELERLVLAHNGTLESERMYDPEFKDLIDSNVFAILFDREYAKTPDIVKALIKTYEDFVGKFAFLFYDKIGKSFYAARGETAELYILYFFINKKKVGYVLNTSPTDLEFASRVFQNVIQVDGQKYEILDVKIEPLEKNTIYRLDELEPVVVGKLEERKKVYIQRTFPTVTPAYSHIVIEKKEEASILYTFLMEFDMSLEYFELIINSILDKTLLSISESDWEFILGKIIPYIKKKCSKNILKEWRKIKEDYVYPDYRIHLDFPDLVFPYFLNDVRKLRDLKNEVKNARSGK